ncbi:MAG TPA: autotransporter-associated beta strand repeat-containing protein, partial [Verrucomicrobiae bacterium]
MTSHFSGWLSRVRFAARLLFFAALTSTATAAVPDEVRVPFPTVRLAGKVQGEAAIQSLSDQLPGIAAFYHKTPEQLQQQLRRDKSLWVDPRGRLFFVCNAPAPTTVLSSSNEISAAQLVPLDQTFLLHSRPGSTKTIFLDFDGYTISGTQWNASNNGGADIIAPPWDTDGNPNSFSSSERTIIQQIWLRVSEDYAPFDVDVTTEFPGDAAMTRNNNGDQVYGTRALVSAISQYFGNYGGIAYVGVFDNTGDYYKPALIFPEKLGNSEKNIAEAISHEVGHNLGLSHDGLLNDAADYYSGQGNWAPIMGVGYYEPLSQWSKGEYANANNLEDDLQVIQQNGLSYRADDHGNNIGNATPLSGAVIHTNGVIEQNGDIDFFSFPTGSGAAQFTIAPFERGANLHLSISIYDASGTLITNREVADTSSGAQPVAINLPLSSGIYFLSVEGLGSGDPVTTGYSDYASLGQYSVTIALPGISSWIPIAGGDFSWTDQNNWSAGVPNVSDANARLTNNLAGDQVIALNSAITIGRLLIGDADASHTFTIEDGAGGSLNFNTTGLDASLEKFAGADDVISATVNLFRPLQINNSSAGNLTFSGVINGANGLVKSGFGRLTLAGTNNYFGDTIVSNGTLALTVSGSISNSAVVNVETNGLLDVTQTGEWLVSTNQMIAGSGSVIGNTFLDGGGKIAPGNIGRAGTLTFSNDLALNGNAALIFDLAPTNAIGGGTNDLLEVAGTLSLAGSNTFKVNALGGELVSPGTYTVVQYGSLSGSATNLTYANPLTRYQVSADDSVPGELRLHVSGNPLPIVWQGDGLGNVWSVAGASNWLNDATLDQYYQFDSVTFDDSGSSSPAISLIGMLTPGEVTVASSKNYNFSGSGKLSGGMALNKSGSGMLTLDTVNDFTGSIQISGGVLKPVTSAALGNGDSISVQSTGTLDLNGLNLGDKSVIAEGPGTSGGAIVNNSPTAQLNALRFVSLSGDATFGGAGRWDIRANPTASLSGNGFNLTKNGVNEIWLV